MFAFDNWAMEIERKDFGHVTVFEIEGELNLFKAAILESALKKLLDEGFNPVVFCRYIATARYVAKHLQERFKNATVAVVTGEITSDERREKVDALGDSESQRVLVATDCLSEGINLQDLFDAVVHYDLSWNPTRHEQRDGRVDRFGQTNKDKEVRILTYYEIGRAHV